ncbi:MAG TPA: hypothetical protein VH210_13340, partial [Gaiellaceae bacterium]|nr:hypothetical protein [Gaiellaceae bacterium]
DSAIGLALYRVDGPLVILTRVTGVYPDAWGRRSVVYRRLQCVAGTLSVRLGTDSQLFAGDQLVTAHEGGRVVKRIRVGPTEQPNLRVPLRPNAAGICTVTFRAAAVRVPARVFRASEDTRRLAVHYYAFEYAAR